MLDHGIHFDCSICHLRPMTDADEDKVLELWNQDFVVGNLFMSKTSHEVYRKYFDKYKTAVDEWRFVIEDRNHQFVGTTGYWRVDEETFASGFFAMYPTEEPVLAALNVLTGDWLWNVMKFKRHVFTINAENKRIRRFHTLLGNRFSGRIEERPSSAGGVVRLEHWYGVAENWPTVRAHYAAIVEP